MKSNGEYSREGSEFVDTDQEFFFKHVKIYVP